MVAVVPRLLAVLGASMILLAGCGSSTPHTQPDGFGPAEVPAPPADSPLATCVKPAPTTPKPIDTALADDFSGGRVDRAFSLDGGRFRAAPAPGDAKPGIYGPLALCNLLAASTANNSSMFEAATEHGMSFGLAVVTVADSVLKTGARDYLFGGEDHTATLQPYHSRLAWIAVTKPDVESSCPAEITPTSPRPTPTTTAKPLPAYQILAIDAETGGAGIDYSAKTNNLCGFPGYEAAHVAPATEFVSLPWTLVSRGPGPKAATISYQPRPCDLRDFGMFVTTPPVPGHPPTGPPAVFADRDHPGLVSVDLERILTTCGPGVPTHLLLRSATVATDLPQHLVHAPIGAMDLPD
jgi:hypothetical protein